MTDWVVMVTGGGRGIGRAICERFAASEAQVVATARNLHELEGTRGIIEQGGGRCHVQAADLFCAEDIGVLVDSTIQRFGRIDVLVNNAGVAPRNLIEEMDEAVFNAIVAVNVTAVYRTCRAVWPIMRRQGGGAIINMSSVASVDPFPGFAAYGAAKAWINAWTKALAEEGRQAGIRVFAAAPGAVETRMLRDTFPEFPADQTLQPAEVADVVFALAQPEWRHASGQTLFVRK
jgi:NAD(P)-dependent dehydrogenase (short-subunit alcohol dehydrogenase family)